MRKFTSLVSDVHFRACLAYGFTHMASKQVKVMFIPMPRKYDYTVAKVYHPISLSSILLKTAEKLVDRCIRDGILKEHPPQLGNACREVYSHFFCGA
jgi:hypothetical protein